MAVVNAFSTVGKILYAQLFVSLAASAVFLCLKGGVAAWSGLIGGGAALLPNVYFAYKIYLARFSAPQAVISAFYAGETLKLILTAAIFAMASQIKGVDFLALLMVFAATLSVFWFALYLWRD
jgi:ATP synthase protein I